MSNWVQCEKCGRKNNLSPKRGSTQRCRYCGELVMGTGPATVLFALWTIIAIGCAIAMAVMMANGIK